MMTNNNTTSNSNTFNKMPNGKPPPPPPHAHTLSSLPRYGSARREPKINERAESSLSHEPPYSQHLANQNGQRTTTADRYLRLTQDHFNHNHGPYGSIGSNKHPNTLSGERSPRESECNYIHNNSHYSLPLDHALNAVTPTPTPPALPLRNGQLMPLNSNNTGMQRIPAYNNNNCSNGYATISGGGNHFSGGVAIGVGGNNNNGSLRRYH
ncbi:AP-1 complex subunit gamma-like [Bactrocera tryoni]|uniref:AP-1 complex subunit gamma-like n=1 Tax=Bactrocera tryoni TaxID=59916 RepID=UPI001A98B6B8|nr:AP-1 complex subunit gamma-like [Bactrocera tryoni]